MSLNFQPPKELIDDYLKRPSPGQQATEGINQALQQYAQNKKDEENKKYQQQALTSLDAERKARVFEAGAKYLPEDQIPAFARQNGINLPETPPTAPALPPNTGFSPQGQPMSMAKPEDQPPPLSPLVQAHIDETGHNPMGHKLPTSKVGLDKYREGLQAQKLEQDLAKPGKGPLATITKEKALADGTFDPTKQVMVEPPAPRLDLATKQDQFDQKEWDKIVKDTNPLTASSRSTLGMASKANFQADRALVTLSKPVVTNQEAGNVMADVSAIYQTGSPTQYGMSHQEYATLYGKIQGALQAVTGKPQDALPEAVKKRLTDVLHDMKGTNSLVLKQQLDFTEKGKARIIKKFPGEWKDIRATLENNPDAPGQTTIPQTGPHGPSVTQGGHTYNWNANSGQYE